MNAVVQERVEPAISQNWPLLAFMFIVPLQNIYLHRLPSLGGGLNLLNALVAGSLLFALRDSRSSSYQPGTPLSSSSAGKWALAWALWLVLSLLLGGATLGGLPTDHITALKDQLVPTIMFVVVLKYLRDRKQLVWLLVAAALPVAYMFRVFYAQYATFASWHYSDNMRLVRGTFSELGSNEFAAFFATYPMIVVALLLKMKRTRNMLLFLVPLLALSLYCLLYSHSRGAWLSAIAGLLAMGAVMNWRKTLVVSLLCIALSAPLLKVLPVSVQERASTIFVSEGEQRDNSAESRFVLWEEAMRQFKSSPVLGIGYHTFHHLNPYGKDTHNFFVRALTEQGVIGVLFIAGFLFAVIWQSFVLATRHKDPLASSLGVGMVGAMAAILVGNCFGDRFSYYPLISHFWVLVAVVLVINRGLVAGLEGTDGGTRITKPPAARASRPFVGGPVRS